MALGHLIGGFAKGFAQARQAKLEREEREQERKLRTKLFEIELQKAERQDEARKKLFERLGVMDESGALPGSGPQQGLSPPPEGTQSQQNPVSLLDLLADPQNAALMLQSGMVNASDLLSQQQAAASRQMLEKFMAGGGGGEAGGMELTGVKFDPSGRPMLDFSRPQVWQEVPSPDGMSMVLLDRQGRQIGRRPVGPGERPVPAQTKGQSAIDSQFANEYVEFKAAGGFADVRKSLEQLREAKEKLEKGGLTGPVEGRVPDFLRGFINPDSLAVRDTVEEVVQRNLRLVLGAQFTKEEGERLIARAYNEKLSEEENVKRLDRLIKQIETAAKAKAEAVNYFEKHGTLEGFTGKLWSMTDFNPEGGRAAKPADRMSDDELLRELGL